MTAGSRQSSRPGPPRRCPETLRASNGGRRPPRRRWSRRPRRTVPWWSRSREGRVRVAAAQVVGGPAGDAYCPARGEHLSHVSHDSNIAAIMFCDRMFLTVGGTRDRFDNRRTPYGSQIQADPTRCQAGGRAVSERGRHLPAMQLADHPGAWTHGSPPGLPLRSVPCPVLPSACRHKRRSRLTLRPFGGLPYRIGMMLRGHQALARDVGCRRLVLAHSGVLHAG